MNNEKNTLLYALAQEIAKRDLTNLHAQIDNMKFEQALKYFDGYNLEVDTCTIGAKKELVSANMRFDMNYGNIVVTIFCTPNKGCEIYESSVEVHSDHHTEFIVVDPYEDLTESEEDVILA